MRRNRHRLGELGSYYHVFARGIDRKDLFRDDRDSNTFLLMLREALEAGGAWCYAFALIPNHYHLGMRVLEAPISTVMHRLNTRYGLYFNRRHGGVGHVFQGRFQSVLIQDDDHLKTAVGYIHANPIHAGLVRDERQLRHFRWSGHSALMGRVPHGFIESERVLAHFGRTTPEARDRLSRFVRSVADTPCDVTAPFPYVPENAVAISHADAESLNARNVAAIAGDSARLHAVLTERGGRAAARVRRRLEGWTAESLLVDVCRRLGVRVDRVRAGRKTRKHSEARSIFCMLATDHLGLTLTDAGRVVGLTRSGASRARHVGTLLDRTSRLNPEEFFRATPRGAAREVEADPQQITPGLRAKRRG